MRDPTLRSDFFSRDRVLLREPLITSTQFMGLEGAIREDNAVAFCGCSRLVLELESPCQDISRFNQLTLIGENRSKDPLLVSLKLTHGSRSLTQVPDISFSGGREELPPNGWMELWFPAQSFGSYGTPAGWSDVRVIEIGFGFERDHHGSKEINVELRSLHGEFLERPQGPRLTEPGLVEALRADTPVLRHDDHGQGTPSHGMLPWQHLLLVIPPPHPYPRETADEILAGRIMGRRVPVPPAWDANPLGIQEWTHFLNRHHFMRELVIALVNTEKPRYARALDACIASWVRANPVPLGSNGGSGPSWETLSAAWRLREWIWIARAAWNHPSFRDATRRVMLRSVWEHCRHLMDHRGHPNNWIIVESAALTLAGLAFPEFAESGHWVSTGMDRLTGAFDRQFFHDGVHFEISPLYHAICAQAMLEVSCASRAAGHALSPEFDRRLERSFEYLTALCRPDFTWPSLNDGGSADADYAALLRTAGEIFQRPDFTWAGTRGVDGRAPETTHHVFPAAGIVAMRSHYGADANHLVFRAGPAGAAHVHGDILSMDVTGLGCLSLVDPGVTTYAPEPLTEYYRSAAAHNTILIDGEGPVRNALPFAERIRPAGPDLSCRSVDLLEFAVGTCRGPWTGTDAQIILRRTVVFVRQEYWVVQDSAMGEGKHELTACWQFAPGRVAVNADTFSVTRVDAQGAGFELLPVPGLHPPQIETVVGSLSPVAGWVSINGRDVPGYACRYRLSGTLPLTQEWLLVPFADRRTCGAEVNRRQNRDGSVELEISLPDREPDVITLPCWSTD